MSLILRKMRKCLGWFTDKVGKNQGASTSTSNIFTLLKVQPILELVAKTINQTVYTMRKNLLNWCNLDSVSSDAGR